MKNKSLLILVDMWQTAAVALAQIVKDQRLSMKDADMRRDAASQKLAICVEAMQDLERKNDKLDTYWNELHEKDQAIIAELRETLHHNTQADIVHLTLENARLRQEDEDAIFIIAELRKNLAIAHEQIEVYKSRHGALEPECLRTCRHIGQNNQCGCPLSTCAYDHPASKQELPF